MSKYLVTGGAGFIGSNIVEELVKRGHQVRVVDNFLTGAKENIAAFLRDIELIEGDIRNYELCERVLKGMDYVLHNAALPSVPLSIKTPLVTNGINISGTLNLLTAASDTGIKKFVFASSSSVYGDDVNLPKKEYTLGNPLSPYAVSKLTGEKYCQVFGELFGFSMICLRYFNIFGPKQNPFSTYSAVIPKFINRMLRGERPVIFGDGKQSRDFTYVSNVVEANILASEAENITAGIFNIACGERINLNFLVSRLNKILKVGFIPSYLEPRPADVRHSYADVSLAEEILKYKPLVSFDEGLERTVNWYEEKLK